MSSGALERRLRAGEFAITAEITPPLSVDPQDLIERALPLRGLATAVNVTDGAGATAHLDTLVSAGLLLQNGIEPILQLTCRDRNRIALQSDLLGAAALGMSNVLVVARRRSQRRRSARGEAGVRSRCQRAAAHALPRCATSASCRTGGRSRAASISFWGAPTCRSIRRRIGSRARCCGKLDAGAQFVQTQFCMDAQVLRRYMARLAEYDLPERLFLIVAGAAGLGALGALDPRPAVRLDHSGTADRAAGKRGRPQDRRPSHLSRAHARVPLDPRGRRRAPDGTAERIGGALGDRGISWPGNRCLTFGHPGGAIIAIPPSHTEEST